MPRTRNKIIFVCEIFALFRVICGQKKSGAAAPHSKTSVLRVQSLVKIISARARRRFFGSTARRAPDLILGLTCSDCLESFR